MIERGLRLGTLVTVAVCTLPALGVAADVAPSQLRNKTITASWTASRSIMTPAGQRTRQIQTERLIYVSSAGRAFVKSSTSGKSAELGPGDGTPEGGSRKLQFMGDKLVALAALGSGAGRMTISFGAGFTSCTVALAVGKPASGHLMQRGPDGDAVEILSTEISNQACSVREGNHVAP